METKLVEVLVGFSFTAFVIAIPSLGRLLKRLLGKNPG